MGISVNAFVIGSNAQFYGLAQRQVKKRAAKERVARQTERGYPVRGFVANYLRRLGGRGIVPIPSRAIPASDSHFLVP